MEEIYQLGDAVLNRIPAWPFFLAIARFFGLFFFLPGTPSSFGKLPLVMVFAYVAVAQQSDIFLPDNIFIGATTFFGELLYGSVIGLLARLVVVAADVCGQLIGGSMGLAAGNLMDPNMGVQVTALSYLLTGLAQIYFLVSFSNHEPLTILYRSPLNQDGLFGSFNHIDTNLVILASAKMITLALMLSLPVIGTLLITQFALAVISKSVTTFNVMILSFPILVVVGLFTLSLMLPLMLVKMQHFLEYLSHDVYPLLLLT